MHSMVFQTHAAGRNIDEVSFFPQTIYFVYIGDYNSLPGIPLLKLGMIAIQDLAKTVDNKGQTDVTLLDFSKAFDKVPHHRLLHKLDFYGIRGSLHSRISSFLGNRSQEVLLDGVTSSSAQVQSGVPQGSILGPLLFLLFINDLQEYISPKSTARLFADDCILYRTLETESDARDLQLDLDRLQQWEKDWLMEFHPRNVKSFTLPPKENQSSSYTIYTARH